MSISIDTTFDVYSDTPKGKDPDAYSRTLRLYHQKLWSRRLPNGRHLNLTIDEPKAYLFSSADWGEVYLSSDSIGHTYRYVKAMAPIVSSLKIDEIQQFFSICSTIGAYLIFPSKKIDNLQTINGARGTNYKIKDRFDLTLECIRRHYDNQNSPLSAVLARYAFFFDLFIDFKGYLNFFLLQDLVENDGSSIRFFLPFDHFQTSPLPANESDYRTYRDRLTAFIVARNERISANFN